MKKSAPAKKAAPKKSAPAKKAAPAKTTAPKKAEPAKKPVKKASEKKKVEKKAERAGRKDEKDLRDEFLAGDDLAEGSLGDDADERETEARFVDATPEDEAEAEAAEAEARDLDIEKVADEALEVAAGTLGEECLDGLLARVAERGVAHIVGQTGRRYNLADFIEQSVFQFRVLLGETTGNVVT